MERRSNLICPLMNTLSWKCLLQTTNSCLLQQWALSVAFSPCLVFAALWLVRVCVCALTCVFVSSHPASPLTVADRHDPPERWIILHTHTHTLAVSCTHRPGLEDKWTSLTHRQRCGRAAFPFECSAKTTSRNYTCPCLFDCTRDREPLQSPRCLQEDTDCKEDKSVWMTAKIVSEIECCWL